jgi:hypothetical protein
MEEIYCGGRNLLYRSRTVAFDVDGDGDQTLYFTRIPEDPVLTENWKLIPVYKYYSDSQMEQYGTYPSWKGTNEHEGLTSADIDGDDVEDIVGGGLWFKYLGSDKFSFNTIDGDGNMDIWYAEMTLGGHIKAVNRILFGDGMGNFPHDMIISKGFDLHDSEIVDLDGDGDLDILGKPYDGDAPGLNIWLQNGTGKILRTE